MPYKSRSELPSPVKQKFTPHQQDAFRKAFNNAFDEYHGAKSKEGESKAFGTAYAAAKKASPRKAAKKKKDDKKD